MSESKILIVGGNGYIGSQTNLLMLENGFETVVFDKRDFNKNLFKLPTDKYQTVIGNLLDLEDLRKVFREHKIFGVIHFGACIEVAESQIDPEKYYLNNVLGTLNLLTAMREMEVKNLVFSSTAAVYGIPQESSIRETHAKNPINVYGKTKWMVEQILSDYAQSYDFRAVCLRYFNASGADLQARTGENHIPETHLIPLILQASSGHRDSIKIFGDDYNTNDGTCIRDYIHTVDLADAHIKALEFLSKKTDNKGLYEAINLGTKNGLSVLEIIQKVKEVTKVDFAVEIAQRRAGDPDKLVADNTKAKELLGWNPKYSDLTTIISSANNWYQKQFKI